MIKLAHFDKISEGIANTGWQVGCKSTERGRGRGKKCWRWQLHHIKSTWGINTLFFIILLSGYSWSGWSVRSIGLWAKASREKRGGGQFRQRGVWGGSWGGGEEKWGGDPVQRFHCLPQGHTEFEPPQWLQSELCGHWPEASKLYKRYGTDWQVFIQIFMRMTRTRKVPFYLSRFEEYPKLQELIRLKDELVGRTAHPPCYLKWSTISTLTQLIWIDKYLNVVRCDLETFDLKQLNCKFDTILIEPPLEEYSR